MPFLGTSTGLNTYSGLTYRTDQFFGFFYPPNNSGDDRRPHTAFQELVDVSNDVEQYYFGATARQGGYGTTTFNASQVLPATGGLFDGMAPIVLDTGSGNDPNQDVERDRPAAGQEPDPAADLEQPGGAEAAASGADRARRVDPADPGRRRRRSPRATP